MVDSTAHDAGGSPSAPLQEGSAAAPAADPLLVLIGHLTAVWRSIRVHAAIQGDQAVDGLLRFLVAAVLALISVGVIALLMALGGYFLISGLALEFAKVFNNDALGRTAAGALFLVCPLVLGLTTVALLRRARERRLVAVYRQLLVQPRAT